MVTYLNPPKFFFAALLIIFLIVGCGPPSTPGVGVPISSGGWEVKITKVHTKDRLSSPQGSFTPNEGTIFLVVEYTVSFKGPALGDPRFALFAIAITENGERLAPELFGFEFGKDFVYGGVEEGKAFTVKPDNVDDAPMQSAAVFVIPKSAGNQSFQVQFPDLSNTTFQVKAE